MYQENLMVVVDRYVLGKVFKIQNHCKEGSEPHPPVSIQEGAVFFNPMPILHPIKAVIFDFDGTLAVLNIDFSLMRERVFDLMRRYGVEEEAIQEKYLLEVIDEVYQILWDKNPPDAEGFYQESHSILHVVEMNAAQEGKLIPGAKATLKNLREKGIKVGIITRNCEDAVRKVFPDINHFCDALVSRNSVRRVKPHPEHLTQVIESLRTSVKDSVVVGDHIIDVQAGKRVGMKTVGVLTGRTKKEEFEKAGADYVLEEATEIFGLLFFEQKKWAGC
jgi:phosphoglycolate phosphatase